MATDIKAALAQLDITNDNHWTSDGAPRIDTVKMLAGDQTITRDAITQAAPGFSRSTPTQLLLQAAQDAPPATATAPVANATPAAPQATASAEAATTPPVTTQTQAVQPTQETPNEEIVGMSEADRVQAEFEDETETLQEMYKARGKLAEMIKAQEKKVDALNDKVLKITPAMTTQGAITAYLASQRSQLDERAGKTKFWKENAETLKSIIPKKSPIDAAMARKNTRGTGRPGARK